MKGHSMSAMDRAPRARRPKRLALIAVLAMVVGGLGLITMGTQTATASTAGTPGSSPDNPIVVTSPSQVPNGAVVTSGPTKNPTTCQTAETWTLTVSGTDEVSHQVYLFGRSHQAVAPTEQYRWPVQTREWVPATTHLQYRWHKQTRTKTEVNQTQYRFRTRVQLYGSKEVKSIKGWNFVDGGTTTVRDYQGHNQTVAGHWTQADSGTYYQIPDVVINIVWGPNGVPSSVLGTGTVSLSVYGGPNVNVQYKAEKVTTSDGYTDWGPWSDWQNTPVTANDLTDVQTQQVGTGTYTYGVWTDAGVTDWSDSESHPANTDTVQYVNEETQSVSDGNAHWSDWTSAGYTDWSDSNTKPADTDTTRYGDVETRDEPGTGSPAWTESYPQNVQQGDYDHYTSSYTPDNPPPLNAVTGNPGDTSVPWSELDQHKVVDHAATPQVVTYYAWKDGATCPTPPVVSQNPEAGVGTDCKGEGYVIFENPTGGTVKFKVVFTKASKKHHRHRFITVAAGGHGSLSLKHLKAHSVLKVRALGKTLDKAKVPGSCHKPPVVPPNTGLRLPVGKG